MLRNNVVSNLQFFKFPFLGNSVSRFKWTFRVGPHISRKAKWVWIVAYYDDLCRCHMMVVGERKERERQD